jgi:hypothetical protein
MDEEIKELIETSIIQKDENNKEKITLLEDILLTINETLNDIEKKWKK